jgi:hypothetical protein
MRLSFTQSGHPLPFVDYSPAALGTLGTVGTLDPQTQQIAGIAAAAATTTGSILAASHLMIFGLAGGPLGAAIAGIAAVGLALANLFSGCGQTCVEATKIANQCEPLLLQNLQHYLSAPTHYASMQAAALNNFDFVWAALTKSCSTPALQQAGQNCVQDRQRGACKWTASPGGWAQDSTGKWTYSGYGAAGSGSACWNWFVGYRDPIANDPTVIPDPVGSTVTTDPNTGQVTVTPNTQTLSLSNPYLLIGGGALALFMMYSMAER